MTTAATQFLRSRLGKLCVAIMATTPEEMLAKATAAVLSLQPATPFLEFRLDYLPAPADALPAIQAFLAANTAAIAIATCRRVENGGHYKGTLAAELDLLTQAATAGCHIIDLEIESAEALKPAALHTLRHSGAALLISHHNFTETPDLDPLYTRIAAFHPDFIKIVPTATTLADNLTLLRFLEKTSDHASVVGIAMGDPGVVSRVLGLRSGSTFTFASATAGDETGPGQIDARTLLDLYRVDRIDPATKLYGVAGNPVRSSLSPLMLNTAFRRETVNAAYLPLPAADLPDLLQLVHGLPLHGFSVTMPFKQSILPHLEKTDPLTAKIGACNTVLRAPLGGVDKLYGFNTDVAGIVGPLEKRMPLRNAKILVLGAGGAARAAVFGLKDKGAEVFILNRTPETAQKLAKQAGAKTIKREALPKTTFDIVVNATPAGMAHQPATPILEAHELHAKLVFDLVYNPLDTPLLQLARQQGIPTITGVEMFVQQGARQFEIWTGKPAPQGEMLRVVLHSLKQR